MAFTSPLDVNPPVRRRAAAMGAAALAIAGLVSSVAPPSSLAGNGNPPGNNGTVKVDGVAFDSHPNNEPHPGCTFQIDFYGFDQGVGDAQVSFALQAPTAAGRTLQVTSGDLTPDIGQDAAGGGTDLDASEDYTLSFTGAPHPKQGFHVKLTVNAPGSIGADVKHKVFWVEDCGGTTPPPAAEPPAPTPDDDGDNAPTGVVPVGEDGQVLGAGVGNAPAAPAASAAPSVAAATAAAPVAGAPAYTG